MLADNRVTLYFVLHMYDVPDLLGSTLTVGITLEVDTSVIWVGNADVIVDPEVTTGLVCRFNRIASQFHSGIMYPAGK